MRALIVDDEYVARKSIESLIDWEEMGFEPPLLLPGAEEAYAFCMKQKVDLILTDIEMPRKNGLELIQDLQVMEYETKFIIISCHERFEYARCALRLGVSDYILKDLVTKNELKTVIYRLFPKVNHSSKVELNSQAVFAVAVDDYYKDYNNGWISKLTDNIQHIDAKAADNFLLLTLCIPYSNSSCEMMENVLLVANKVRASAQKLGYTNVSIGIGEELTDEEQAVKALKSRIYLGMNKNLVYSQSCEPPVIDSDKVENTILIIKQLALNDDPDCLRYIDKLFSMTAHSGFVKVNCFDYLFLKLCSHAFYIASKNNRTFSSINRQSLKNEEEMKNTIKQMYRELIDQRLSRYRTIVTKTIALIEEEYKSDISLNYLAEKLYTHKGYLCRAFKEDVGENIMQYIMNRKLSEAKKLLKDNKLKLFEISECLGFATPQYFSYVFKKHIGCSPNDYKKLEELKNS